MPKVLREDADQLNSFLTVSLAKSDYEPKYLSELNKYRDKAHLKGFRKGKTPMTVIKKMYGKAILAEIVNELFQKELFNFINEEKLSIIGEPLLAEDQEPLDLDTKIINDLEMKFEVGISPDFELVGLDKNNVFDFDKVEVDDKVLAEEFLKDRLRLGTTIHPEEDIQENDSLSLSVKELDGDSDHLKENGHSGEFSILVDRVADESVKNELLTKKKWDTIKINIFELEMLTNKQDKAQFVRKYYLRLEDEDDSEVNPWFLATIENVTRRELAPLDASFFKQIFGPESEIEDESQALEEIRKFTEKDYDIEAERLLLDKVIDDLAEKNPVVLPHNFLKRWMKTIDDRITDENLDDKYDSFVKGLWKQIIQSKMVKKFDIKVENEDIVNKAYQSMGPYVQYLQGLDQEKLKTFMEQILSDQKQVMKFHQAVESEKLQSVIRNQVGLNEIRISIEAFENLLREKTIQQNQDEADFSFEEEE